MLLFINSILSIIKNKQNKFSLETESFFFSENENYSSHLIPFVKEFLKNNKKILFITSQINDPVFNIKNENLKVFILHQDLDRYYFF